MQPYLLVPIEGPTTSAGQAAFWLPCGGLGQPRIQVFCILVRCGPLCRDS